MLIKHVENAIIVNNQTGLIIVVFYGGITMAFCKQCGQQIDDNAVVCPNCGAAQQENPQVTPAVVDNGGFGWGLLGFLIPIVGLILFLVWKDTKPKTAKAAGKGALISVIASVVIYIITFVIGVAGSM